MLILRLAWRNLWRSKRRTLSAVAGVSVGLLIIILFQTIMDGSKFQMFNNAIRSGLGHFQIIHKGYHEEPSLDRLIWKPQQTEQILQKQKKVQLILRRIEMFGLLGTEKRSSGALVIGIDPLQEEKMIHFKKKIIAGEYLKPTDRKKILLGKYLAKKLRLKVGDKVAFMTRGVYGALEGGFFYVSGIYRAGNPILDRRAALIPRKEADELGAFRGALSRIIVLMKGSPGKPQVRSFQKKLDSLLSQSKETRSLQVLSWWEIIPSLVKGLEMKSGFVVIIALVFFLMAAFIIFNMFSTIIFERIREIGMLRSLGLRPFQIFSILQAEALLIGVVGVVLGLIVGVGIAAIVGHYGIPLGSMSELSAGMDIQMPERLYTYIIPAHLVGYTLTILLVALLSALPSAIRAARFRPAEALRHV